jgi:hypothetical protein
VILNHRCAGKSLRTLAGELSLSGHSVSYPKVGDLLRELGYSLQANRKMLEGTDHPDRNAQFEFINDLTKRRLAAGNPVISVDTTKKELVGAYKNNGTAWRPEGKPELVKVHNFIDKELGRANPYGVGQCRNRPRHSQFCGRNNTPLVEHDGQAALSRGIRIDDHGRWWRQ